MEPIKIIDFHTHIYPWPEIPSALQATKIVASKMLSPVSQLHHALHSQMRKLPQPLRGLFDELGTPMSVPHLLAESSVEDLLLEMQANMVVKAVVMPHPPLISNHFVLSECKDRPQLVPGVFLDPETIQGVADLEVYWNAGYHIYKINPIQCGKAADDVYYQDLLQFLNEKKAIVVLHTGNIESKLFFKLPTAGDIEHYRPWFHQYKDIHFLAAHMNFHEPQKAVDLAREFSQLSLICSWQPTEVIEAALRILGGKKLFFGSDWPLLGGNISYKKQQFISLFENRKITQTDLDLILWKNAEDLLSLA